MGKGEIYEGGWGEGKSRVIGHSPCSPLLAAQIDSLSSPVPRRYGVTQRLA